MMGVCNDFVRRGRVGRKSSSIRKNNSRMEIVWGRRGVTVTPQVTVRLMANVLLRGCFGCWQGVKHLRTPTTLPSTFRWAIVMFPCHVCVTRHDHHVQTIQPSRALVLTSADEQQLSLSRCTCYAVTALKIPIVVIP